MMALISPYLVWIAAAGWLAAAGVGTVQEFRVRSQCSAAYAEGKTAGRGEGAAATLAEAKKTADAEREAAENTPLPADKQAIRDLCKRKSSCREKGTIK